MKTLLRYISLLIISGLMIPIALCDTCVYINSACIETPAQLPAAPAGNPDAKPFSLIHDVIEKLLPAASFLK